MYSFHHLLMKSYCALRRNVMGQAQREGLTAGQPKILEFLLTSEGVEQNKIARHCEIEAATAGSILNRMESAGLIERRRMGQNRRSLYVYLTEKGRMAAQKVENIFAATEERTPLPSMFGAFPRHKALRCSFARYRQPRRPIRCRTFLPVLPTTQYIRCRPALENRYMSPTRGYTSCRYTRSADKMRSRKSFPPY